MNVRIFSSLAIVAVFNSPFSVFFAEKSSGWSNVNSLPVLDMIQYVQAYLNVIKQSCELTGFWFIKPLSSSSWEMFACLLIFGQVSNHGPSVVEIEEELWVGLVVDTSGLFVVEPLLLLVIGDLVLDDCVLCWPVLGGSL